jgi:hypothetical protein
MCSRAREICFVPHRKGSYCASSEYMLFLVIRELSGRTEDAPQHTLGSLHKQILHRYQGVIARWRNTLLAQRWMTQGTFISSIRIFPTAKGLFLRIFRIFRIFPRQSRNPSCASFAYFASSPDSQGTLLAHLSHISHLRRQPKDPSCASFAYFASFPGMRAEGRSWPGDQRTRGKPL